MPEGSTAYEWFEFIGHPFTAILVACLVAIYGLAMRQGMPKDKVMEICGHALQPAGIILLVIGAGGVFKQVLVDSGVGPALGEALTGMGLPIAITCFVLAAAVRIIQGSATVACLTAVGLVMPVIEQLKLLRCAKWRRCRFVSLVVRLLSATLTTPVSGCSVNLPARPKPKR
ncbi:gluconate transporter GntU, low affinity GNT 1 system [Escherichia coli]|uniref:Gluconate transporter GntU, low affinity GNT 1 system n=1 Tax=Escherichia coli TaxID=562 RepID=A0A376KJF4_ECOLX|nr:gluconate transporter GntU, low affinity GNT 1 system [Escherichia coli]